MNFKSFGKYIAKAVIRYNHYLPYVVFLKLILSVVSVLDPKNPKGTKSKKQIDADLNLRNVALSSDKQNISNLYSGDKGKVELKNQIINSLALSTAYMPSRKFCLFAEQYLLSNRIDFSFAKALPISR